MELTRRHFAGALAAALAALGAGLWRVGAALARSRRLAAIRRGEFPGRVRPMAVDEVARPGRWRG